MSDVPPDLASLERRMEAARKAVTDECGSRLCMWVDRGTERVCTRDYGHGFCVCETVARAAIRAYTAA